MSVYPDNEHVIHLAEFDVAIRSIKIVALDLARIEGHFKTFAGAIELKF